MEESEESNAATGGEIVFSMCLASALMIEGALILTEAFCTSGGYGIAVVILCIIYLTKINVLTGLKHLFLTCYNAWQGLRIAKLFLLWSRKFFNSLFSYIENQTNSLRCVTS